MLSWLVSRYLQLPEFRGRYRILRKILPLVEGSPVLSRYGVYMVADSRDTTNFYALSGQTNVDYRDVYEEVIKLQPGMAFIDIGANAGVFSLVAAKALHGTGPVIAFEPSQSTFAKLVRNAMLNNLREFYPFRLAIGSDTNVVSFAEDEGHHSGKAHIAIDGKNKVLMSDFRDLNTILSPLVNNRDIMIKIDVEGAEVMVVKSMADFLKSKNVVKIVVEVDANYLSRLGSEVGEIYSTMAAAGLKPRFGLNSRPHFNEVFERHSEA